MAGAVSRPARVLSRRDVGGGLTLVALDVDASLAASFVTPGQYTELRLGGKKGYFALASAVLAARWELVVKDSGEASRALLDAPLGEAVTVLPALGAGFPVEAAEHAPAVVVVTGSAVGVLRPLAALRAARGDLALTYVFVGARSVPETPLAEELAALATEGARVWLAASRDASGAVPGVRVVRGYVQDAIDSALAAGEVPASSVVFAAGHDAMVGTLRVGAAFSSVYTNV